MFEEVSKNTAIGYFSGMGDGCGFAPVPKDVFSSTKAAIQFLKSKWMEAAVETQKLVRQIREEERVKKIAEGVAPENVEMEMAKDLADLVQKHKGGTK